MNVEKVPLALLRDSAQPRDLVQANVDMLRASIEQVGLIQPIRVRPAGVIVRGLGEQGFQIVAGHHRVAAARALGWTEIDAIVDTAEHLQAELMEIDENLCRAELTASQRAQAIKRRKQIWEALHPNSGTSCPTIQVWPPRVCAPTSPVNQLGSPEFPVWPPRVCAPTSPSASGRRLGRRWRVSWRLRLHSEKNQG